MARHHQAAVDQGVGSVADMLNQTRIEEFIQELSHIADTEELALALQNQNFQAALSQVEKVRHFLGDPSKILGSAKTKHGEIAESIEVHIRNARSLLQGQAPEASLDVARTGPVDYRIGADSVQSKFINGTNNNLSAVLKHLDANPEFANDGSYYHIPRDTHEVIQKLRTGENPEGFNPKTIRAILQKVEEIEQRTGRPFDNAVRPAISDYPDVQQGTAHTTVDKHESQLRQTNQEKLDEIKDESDQKRAVASDNSRPSLQEGLKAGAIGAAIGGAFTAGMRVYTKCKEGTPITEFSPEDWKDVGFDFLKGGARGGITGLAVYELTNYVGMGAPVASAVVSCTFGVAQLCKDLKDGAIDLDEFVEQGQVLCLESGMIALGATVGQALIPIPVVGALVGSFAASTLLGIAKDYLREDSLQLEAKLRDLYESALATIDREYRKIVQQIMEEYERLGTITRMAFDFSANAALRFQASQELALAHGIRKSEILMTEKDVDDFFL